MTATAELRGVWGSQGSRAGQARVVSGSDRHPLVCGVDGGRKNILLQPHLKELSVGETNGAPQQTWRRQDA